MYVFGVPSRGLKWENKTYKLERSITGRLIIPWSQKFFLKCFFAKERAAPGTRVAFLKLPQDAKHVLKYFCIRVGEKRSYLPNEVTVTDAISSGWIPLLALQVYSPSIADAWFVMTNVRFLWINFRSLYHVIVGSGPPRAVQVSIKSSPGTRALIGSNGFIRGGSVSRNNKKHILETIKKFPNCLFFFGISPRLKRLHEPSRSFLRYSYERFALLTFFLFPWGKGAWCKHNQDLPNRKIVPSTPRLSFCPVWYRYNPQECQLEAKMSI